MPVDFWKCSHHGDHGLIILPLTNKGQDLIFYSFCSPILRPTWKSISPWNESSLYLLALSNNPQHLSEMNLKKSYLRLKKS